MQFHEELMQFLREQSFAVLCLALDLGEGEEAVLVVKSSRDLIEGLREARAPAELGWVVDQTSRGPVACGVIRVAGAAVGELAGEVYFDPADPEDLAFLQRMRDQDRLRIAFLDEDLRPVWMADLAWDEAHRLHVDQVMDRAEELLETAESPHFDEAKERFQEAYSLSRLLEQALPLGTGPVPPAKSRLH